MKLKNGFICVIALVLVIITDALVVAGNDLDDFRYCSQCGMDRKAYGYSRMVVSYKDGTRAGVCSLHCAVADSNAKKGSEIASLEVADRNNRELINAEKAFWVMGGKKRGVMTSLAKWAFAKEQDAHEFVKNNGGEVIPFDQVMKSASKEVAEMNK